MQEVDGLKTKKANMKRDLQKFSSELRMQLQNGLQLLKRSGSLEQEDLVWLKRQKQVASAVASAQAKILPSERGRSVREVRSATIASFFAQRLTIHAQSSPQHVSAGANA